MFNLLRVSILTAVTTHVWAQSRNIFTVTSQVLGLSENDFKQNDNMELFNLMSKEDQRNYRELEYEGGEAYSFIVELWTAARDAAIGKIDKQAAYQKVSHLYDTMSDRGRRRLLHYFAKVANALAVQSLPGGLTKSSTPSGNFELENALLQYMRRYLEKIRSIRPSSNWFSQSKSYIDVFSKKQIMLWTPEEVKIILKYFTNDVDRLSDDENFKKLAKSNPDKGEVVFDLTLSALKTLALILDVKYGTHKAALLESTLKDVLNGSNNLADKFKMLNDIITPQYLLNC